MKILQIKSTFKILTTVQLAALTQFNNRAMIINNSKYLISLFILFLYSFQSAAQQTPSGERLNGASFYFKEGVVIGTDYRYMYVMNTDGGVNAIRLSNGKKIWNSNIASKPLMLIGNLLICQVETKTARNTFKIAGLDVRRRGHLVYMDSVSLPKNVQVSIDDQMNSSFRTQSKVALGSLYVFWKYIFMEIEANPPVDSIPDLPQVTQGIVKIDPINRKISPTTIEYVPDSIVFQSPPNLQREELLKGKPTIQFRSIDNKYVLISQKIGNDKIWDKYLWLIFDRATGTRIGSIRNYSSYTPFFIWGQKIYFETGPYYRQSTGAKHLSIQSVDLKSGKINWSIPIRDINFKGLLPLNH